MNRIKNALILIMIQLMVGTTFVPAIAGGLYIQEFATPSSGTADAGAEAWANDASTAIHNPAGMTLLEGNQFMAGIGVSSTTVEFEASANTPVAGDNGGNAGGTLPLGSFSYVHSFSKDFKLGISSYAPAAAVVDYGLTWAGRKQCTETSILMLKLDTTLAYRVNEWLSIGGGPSFIYSELELKTEAVLPGSQVAIDGNETDVSFSLGLTAELSKNTRLGLVYWYGVEIDYSGDLTRNPLNITVAADTNIVYPQSIRTGIYHKVNDKLAMVGTIGWENWRKLENVNLTVGVGTVPVPKNWEDTWHFSAGLHYRISDPWLLQCGIAYDTSPVDSVNRTADMAVDRQIRYAVGALYEWSEKLSIGGQFKYMDLGDARIDSSTLIGEYDKNHAMVASLSFNWKW